MLCFLYFSQLLLFECFWNSFRYLFISSLISLIILFFLVNSGLFILKKYYIFDFILNFQYKMTTNKLKTDILYKLHHLFHSFYLFIYLFWLGFVCCMGGTHCDNSKQVYTIHWLDHPTVSPPQSLLTHLKQLQEVSLFYFVEVYEVHQPYSPITDHSYNNFLNSLSEILFTTLSLVLVN
jgi:hypothetical protein